MKKIVILAIMIALMSTTSLYATINILVYGNKSNNVVNTLNASDLLNASKVTYADEITSELLSSYDVFFACTSYHHNLDSKGSIIAQFLQSGGGVVVGQSNVAGPIDWLPASLNASVATLSYPDSGPINLTPSGQTHEIFAGLSASEIGTRPTDTLYTYDISPAWEVLSVYSRNNSILSLAVGQYGNGRLVLWPSNIHYDDNDQPSISMDENVFEWVAVPEPASMLLLALGAVAIRKRKM